MPLFSLSEATTNAKRKHKANKRKHKANKRKQSKAKAKQQKQTEKIMSNPRGFMEPIYEQNEDAGYDWDEEHFEDEKRYYAKYGGNACLVCAGGSYINPAYIKPTDVKTVKPKL